jgi:hypothetical protein
MIADLDIRLRKIEALLGSDFTKEKIARTRSQDGGKKLKQSSSAFGIYTALCVDTIDIYKQNRVRIFCPLFHDPNSEIKKLPFAYPISAFGGFDDCGVSWVPPAGSTVLFAFEGGNRGVPYYFGTTWSRNRGPDGKHYFGIPVPEYEEIYEGKRKGYLCGPNDGSQVLPPWNTESYNGFDITSPVDLEVFPDAQKRMTYPNIFGFKTPEKHMLKMVDGDARCNRKWKRIELMSGNGNWLIMKDDHLHYCGQWAHPTCGSKKGDVSCIDGIPNPEAGSLEDTYIFNEVRKFSQALLDELGFDPNAFGNEAITDELLLAQLDDIDIELGKKKEKPASSECGGKIIGGDPDNQIRKEQVGANPFFKQQSECRPYKGPQTPQNNKCDLPQTGIQLLSISGHTFVMDDSVKDPQGSMDWSRSTEPFSFGCTDMYMGRTYWKSATGHFIEMNDLEKLGDTQKTRGASNGIKLKSALGNQIFLCDDSEGPTCPSPATANQGVTITSTSNHEIKLCDEGNDRTIRCRSEGSEPQNNATKAYVRIRSGYGLTFEMADTGGQKETDKQRISLIAPQKTNTNKGAHVLLMQERSSGPGVVVLRAGGDLILSATDNLVDVVGTKKSPANRISYTTNSRYEIVDETYFLQANTMFAIGKDKAYILAGKDYPVPPDKNGKAREKAPGIYPVIVFKDGKLVISDRVYASASSNSCVASVYNLVPNVKQNPNCRR